ncbi:flagellar biosynthesis regulator FlaF [uncultured Algimonas sp.]|uniref:flagellar biosynthesis regulator FlaF n=1 Tax=uncultured Algimonas sp. TaxID=1547920 RepID=UPI002615A331|nr:flagellar biosynthesis regulator FlaF [uncultured Algimonas sp.]
MALMTAHAFNAQSAYGNSGRAIGSDRDVEVQVFRTAITRLRPLAGPDFKLDASSAPVLADNLRLWDMLVVDLAHPDNPIDTALNAQLLGLARFVRAHTQGLYAGTGTVDVLIDINTAILQGLMGQTGDASGASQAA